MLDVSFVAVEGKRTCSDYRSQNQAAVRIGAACGLSSSVSRSGRSTSVAISRRKSNLSHRAHTAAVGRTDVGAADESVG
jgi:hypothetical protein